MEEKRPELAGFSYYENQTQTSKSNPTTRLDWEIIAAVFDDKQNFNRQEWLIWLLYNLFFQWDKKTTMKWWYLFKKRQMKKAYVDWNADGLAVFAHEKVHKKYKHIV